VNLVRTLFCKRNAAGGRADLWSPPRWESSFPPCSFEAAFTSAKSFAQRGAVLYHLLEGILARVFLVIVYGTSQSPRRRIGPGAAIQRRRSAMDTTTLTESLAVLKRGRQCVDLLLREQNDAPHRATALTRKLHAIWPAAFMYACVLRSEENCHVSVLDGAGAARPDWAKILEAEALPWLRAAPSSSWSPALPVFAKHLSHHPLLVQPIEFRHRVMGILALAALENTPATAVAQELLATCADRLACRLALESTEQELDQQTALANCGEVTSAVIHEFNNFLNAMLLHVAVLEEDVATRQHPELSEIRKQGAEVASLIKHLQQYGRDHRPDARHVDFNRIVTAAIARLSAELAETEGTAPDDSGPTALIVMLASESTVVNAAVADLKRICVFVLRGAVASATTDTPVTIRTDVAGASVVLTVLQSTGSSINLLELAACKGLARRLKGKIAAERQPAGATVLTLTLPLAAS
jgi:hypothetical protein